MHTFHNCQLRKFLQAATAAANVLLAASYDAYACAAANVEPIIRATDVY
jgi:hypothetical protein